MSIHNIGFDEVLMKVVFQLSSNTNLICSDSPCRYSLETHCLRDPLLICTNKLCFMEKYAKLSEPRHEKTNVLDSDLVQHKPGCTATEGS